MAHSPLKAPVFPVKLTRPELQAVYPRTRLFDLMSATIGQSAIWICGPAGSGKTTLANSFIDSLDLPCLWYNVNEQDKDIASFFYHMGKFAEQINPEKQHTLPFLTQEFFPGIASFTTRFFELFSAILPSRHVIVLDNYQDVGEETQLHDVVCGAISCLQKKISFFILSRKEPPGVLARERARCSIQVLGWHHLQLDRQETFGVIQCISDQAFDEQTVTDIHAKTGGWVSGLLLLLKSGEFDHIEPGMLTQKTPEVIFDYLKNIVFQRLDKAHQALLLTLCHLPVVSLDAAVVLCGKNSPKALEMLNRENRFVYRVSGTGVGYDFHPLFREFLQKRAAQFFSRSDLSAILSKSADIINQEGHPTAAVGLYIQAHNFARAIELILNNALILSIQGRVATLLYWIHSLPSHIVESTPWLLFWKGICIIPESPERAKPLFQKALSLFERADDQAGCLMALAGIMDSISLQFSRFQELDPCIDLCAEFEKKFGDMGIPEIHLKLTSSVLNALVLRRPDSQELKKWETRGWDILQTVKNVNQTVSIFSPLIILNILKGELQTSGHLLEMFSEVSHKKTAPFSYLILQNLKIFHSWLNSDFEAGKKAAQTGMAVEKETGIPLVFLGLRVHGAASAMGSGNLAKARQLLDEIPRFLGHQGIWMQGLYHIISSWYHSLTGDTAAFGFHASQGFKKSFLSGNPVARSAAHLMIARFFSLTGKFKAADIHLEKCIQIAEKLGLSQDKFMALLTRASLYLCQNRMDQAHKVLAEALKLGRQKNFRYGFFWDPKEIAGLCAQALKQNMETPYVRDLIVFHHLMPESLPLDVPEWPWPVTLSSLGGFAMKINGDKAALKGKAKKQPLLLIKYLMAKGGQKVPEYDIQDALWPDSDGDAAQNAYTTTLHRARKLLQHKAALIHTHGRLSFNKQMVWTDTELFERCCHEIENDLKNLAPLPKGDASNLLHSLDRLFSLYQGSFLAGDQNLWALSTAQQLKFRYVHILERAGQEYYEGAIHCFRRGLYAEPLAEAFYRNLIHLYLKMDRPVDASRIYKQYEERFRIELGEVSSKAMMSLKNAIAKK